MVEYEVGCVINIPGWVAVERVEDGVADAGEGVEDGGGLDVELGL